MDSTAFQNEPTPTLGDHPVIPQEETPAALRDHVRYRILKKLGFGGMGTVYLAEHKLMHRQVALKVIRPDLVAQPQLIQRFQREMQAAAKLSHPNIVTAFDAEQAGNCHFLVMEYVEGTDLGRLLKEQGPFDMREACDCIRQAALGLQHAHEHQLIHRDLKPQNLMRTVAGQVKILDFGLARVVQGMREDHEEQSAIGGVHTGSETVVGALLGTPAYMAPEQADNASQADIRADIYSLGCTLYHLLGGSVPFPGRSAIKTLGSHTEEQSVPLNSLRPQLPPALIHVVARMMAKEPASRYQTPIEAATALEPWCLRQTEVMDAGKPAGVRTGNRRLHRWLLPLAACLCLIGTATYFASGWLNRDTEAAVPLESPDSAPFDTSNAELLVHDDFSRAAKLPLFPPSKATTSFFQKHGEFVKFEGQRLVLRLDRRSPPRFISASPMPTSTDFVCKVRARVKGHGDAGWAIVHDGVGADSTLWVMIAHDGTVEIMESGRTAARAFHTSLAKYQLPTGVKPNQWHTLMVRHKEQVLEVLVNAQAIGEPIRLPREYGAGTQDIVAWDRNGGESTAEFTRYTLWRLR